MRLQVECKKAATSNRALCFLLSEMSLEVSRKSAGREGTRDGRNVSDDDDRKNELMVKRKERKEEWK